MTIATGTLPPWHDSDHILNTQREPSARPASKGVVNALLLANAGTLMREARNHFLPSHDKGLARALTGYSQLLAGAVGMQHYGTKFIEHPSMRSALGFTAYTGFAAEGFFRMYEGELTHPQATAAVGAATALIKAAIGGPLTTIPYVLDAMCNVAEYAHGATGELSGAMAAMHAFTQHWRTSDLAGLQRNTGRVMVLIAAFKTLGLAADREPGPIDQAKFERGVRDAYRRLDGEEWGRRIDRAEEASPLALKACMENFFLAMLKHEPDVPHQFAHVIDESPVVAEALIRAHPDPALQAMQQLEVDDPQRTSQLRTRYKVDAAFR
jgi:hypothetical protein